MFTICNTFYLHISETRKLVDLTQVRDLSSKWSWAPQDWSLEEKYIIIICAIISVKWYNYNYLCNHNYNYDYTHLQITIVFMITITIINIIFKPWPSIDTDEVDTWILEIKKNKSQMWKKNKLTKNFLTSRAKRGNGENFSFRVPSSSGERKIKMIFYICAVFPQNLISTLIGWPLNGKG